MPVLAAIDIGTHSVRLVVVDLHSDGSWTTLDQRKEYVRLGEGEFAGDKSRLSEAALERCSRVCALFADVARGFGASEVIALATAAAREAANQDELVERIAFTSGGAVVPRVISGTEEARLIYLGVSSGLEMPDDDLALFMDIGGGSTELVVGDKHRYYFLDSLKMGAIRLTGEIQQDRDHPVTAETWERLQRTVRSILEPAARQIRREGFVRMFGSSGTIGSLAEIASRRRSDASGVGSAGPLTLRGYELHLSDIQQISQMLCKLTLEQRRKVPGLGAERADIIVAGAAIAQTVMETVGAQSIIISERGLREGIVIDYLLREGARIGVTAEAERDLMRDASVRERSTRRLARRTEVDIEHAETVTRLALQLFDEMKEFGLHDCTDDDRELLGYAGLLHDCGFFISHTNHQLHSYYFIRHSELLGFNDVDTEVMALIALYHRKGLPKEKNPAYAALPERERMVVRIASCIVRIAEALDRSHLGLVTNVRLTRPFKTGSIGLSIETAPSVDPALEYWAVEAQLESLKKTFGVPFGLVPTSLARQAEEAA